MLCCPQVPPHGDGGPLVRCFWYVLCGCFAEICGDCVLCGWFAENCGDLQREPLHARPQAPPHGDGGPYSLIYYNCNILRYTMLVILYYSI